MSPLILRTIRVGSHHYVGTKFRNFSVKFFYEFDFEILRQTDVTNCEPFVGIRRKYTKKDYLSNLVNHQSASRRWKYNENVETWANLGEEDGKLTLLKLKPSPEKLHSRNPKIESSSAFLKKKKINFKISGAGSASAERYFGP